MIPEAYTSESPEPTVNKIELGGEKSGTETLRQELKEIEDKYQNMLLNPLSALLLDAAIDELGGDAYKHSFDARLATKIWMRLKEETDVVDNWEIIEPGIAKLPNGILQTRDISEITPYIGKSVKETPNNVLTRFTGIADDKRGRADNSAGWYIQHTQSIWLNQTNITHQYIRNLVDGGFDESDLSGSVSLAHELTHDSNASYTFHRAPQVDESPNNKYISAAKQILKLRGYRADFTIRETLQEREFSNTSWGEFIAEVTSDMAGVEVGTRLFQENHTSKRVLNAKGSYLEAKKLPQEELERVENKICVLSSMGLNAPLLGMALRAVIIEEFTQSKRDKPELTMKDFVTTSYVIDLLDQMIEEKSGSDTVEQDFEIRQIEELRLQGRLRYWKQKLIFNEEAIKYIKEKHGDEFIKFGTDNVALREYGQGSVYFENYALVVDRELLRDGKYVAVTVDNHKGNNYVTFRIGALKEVNTIRNKKTYMNVFEDEDMIPDEDLERLSTTVAKFFTEYDLLPTFSDSRPGTTSRFNAMCIQKLKH
jgi:hypothetical protein